MAVYTDLKKEDIELILNEYGLNLISYSRIKTGILNTNYAIITNFGKFIMRIFEGEREKIEEKEELDFLEKIKNIIPCTVPIKNRKDSNYVIFQNKMVAIFKCLEGEKVKEIDENILRNIGQVLGKLHQFSENKKINRRSRVSLKENFKKVKFDELFDFDGNKLIEKYKEVEKIEFESLPTGIIHSDIFPDNVLTKDGKITGVLDFNECQTSYLIYDIVIVINFWIKINKFPKDREEKFIKEFLEEYEKYRKLNTLEKKMLKIAEIKVALTFILLRIVQNQANKNREIFIENKSYIELMPLIYYK